MKLNSVGELISLILLSAVFELFGWVVLCASVIFLLVVALQIIQVI